MSADMDITHFARTPEMNQKLGLTSDVTYVDQATAEMGAHKTSIDRSDSVCLRAEKKQHDNQASEPDVAGRHSLASLLFRRELLCCCSDAELPEEVMGIPDNCPNCTVFSSFVAATRQRPCCFRHPSCATSSKSTSPTSSPSLYTPTTARRVVSAPTRFAREARLSK